MIHPGQSFGGEFDNEIGKRDVVSFSTLMWYEIGIRLLVGLSWYYWLILTNGQRWRTRAQLTFKSSLPVLFSILKSEFQIEKGFQVIFF